MVNVGDQRAHDLIDAVDGEPDPQHQIELLQRALEYSTTGVQASKAYQGLGSIYEQFLDDPDQAITFYTLSLEAEPDLKNPFVLLWRGELYFQKGDVAAARCDFEHALVGGLWSPERGEAEQRLVEIKAACE